MKILIVGWFSFEYMGATAGDLIACDLIGNWLSQANISYDVAVVPPFKGNVNWKEVDPFHYTDVIFVCGPFGNGWPVTEFLERFAMHRLIGVNLTMLQSLDEWNPFDLLWERDSSRSSNPDITLYAPAPKIPVVGIILAHKQKEYGERSLHEVANEAIQRLIDKVEVSAVPIDTALENNNYGLRTPGEVEALISKMDVVITTRLHGTVLALKNGVPAIPIDPIAGGAKITRQVETLDWPILLKADQLNDVALKEAFDYCLTKFAKAKAHSCIERAIQRIEQKREEFMDQLLVFEKNHK